MKIRKINRAIHRDLGYFFFGMAIIYGLSGIALNHRHHWNPNYIITQEELSLSTPDQEFLHKKDLALFYLEQIGEKESYRTQLVSNDNIRIFINGGTVNINTLSGQGNLEIIRKRHVFFQVNFLHYNAPKKLWTWFSDLFAAGLIVLAITGLFILKGRNGITQRGAWLTGAGIIIPLVFLYVYLSA